MCFSVCSTLWVHPPFLSICLVKIETMIILDNFSLKLYLTYLGEGLEFILGSLGGVYAEMLVGGGLLYSASSLKLSTLGMLGSKTLV